MEKGLAKEEDSAAEELFESIKDYVSTRYELTRLRLVDRSSEALAFIIGFGLVFVTLLFFLFFISYGVAIYLSQLMNVASGGFLVVGGIYLIAVIVLYYTKKQHIHNPLSNRFIKELLK